MLSMVSTYREPSRCEFEEVEYCNGEIIRGLTDWGTLQVWLIRIVRKNVIWFYKICRNGNLKLLTLHPSSYRSAMKMYIP